MKTEERDWLFYHRFISQFAILVNEQGTLFGITGQRVVHVSGTIFQHKRTIAQWHENVVVWMNQFETSHIRKIETIDHRLDETASLNDDQVCHTRGARQNGQILRSMTSDRHSFHQFEQFAKRGNGKHDIWTHCQT